MSHDGYARAIAPVHTPYDGDTIFAARHGRRGRPRPTWGGSAPWRPMSWPRRSSGPRAVPGAFRAIRRPVTGIVEFRGERLHSPGRPDTERRWTPMKKIGTMIAGTALALAIFILLSLPGGVAAKSADGEGGLGPQSAQAIGVKKVLMVAVRFSDVTPTVPLDVLRQKVVERFNALCRRTVLRTRLDPGRLSGLCAAPRPHHPLQDQPLQLPSGQE